jgi:hypothetical protein
MNEALAHQPQKDIEKNSLDAQLDARAETLRQRKEALLAELRQIDAELSPEDTKNKEYIASLFGQAEAIAQKKRLTQEERANLKVLLADLQAAKAESGGLTTFEWNGQESSIDAAIDNVGTWLNESTETITQEEITFTEQITNLVKQSEELLRKEDLTKAEQTTLEAIMKNVMALRDANPQFADLDIDTKNGVVIYDSANDAIGYMAQKLNEAHIKDTDKESIAAIEQQINGIGNEGTAKRDGNIELSPELQGDIYIADKIQNQTNIWVQRTNGTWQQGKATNYSDKDGRVTVAFSTPEGVKIKRPTAEEFLRWQKESPDTTVTPATNIEPMPATTTMKSSAPENSTSTISPDNKEEMSELERAQELWNMLIAAQPKIKAIKTGFFGPSPKFEGRVSSEFDGNENGLNLSNADKMIAWLNKNGRTQEANMVDAYSDAFVEYQKSAAEVRGVGNTGVQGRNVINESRRDMVRAARKSANIRGF